MQAKAPFRCKIQLKLRVVQLSLRTHVADEIEPPVKVYRHPVPRGLMQPVYVLVEQHPAPTDTEC